jgi:hypothetical protein
MEAATWHPDDPRLEALAIALTEKLLADREGLTLPNEFLARPDAAARYGQINHHRDERSPAMARLTMLIESKLRAAGIDVPKQ